MADADAREHPTLFVGDIVGHAHNEWLEILADLGIVGFALMAVVLGATLVGLVRNLRQARTEQEHTFGFGLLGGLVGLIVTEATDVGLRMPGLPIVFWTVVALAWVRVRPAAGRGWSVPVPYRRAVGIGGLGAALVGAAFIGTSASVDFQGALAQRQSAALAGRGQWDAALQQAALAQRGRWSIEGWLAAAHQYHTVAHEAATDRFARLARMLGRFENPGQIPANVRTLADEDHKAFELYASECLGSGIQLLNRMPGYPWTAGRMAETLLMKQRVEAELATLGLIEQAGSYLEAAYHWMRTEYERDPYEPWSALRLFGLVGELGRPMEEQLNVLCVALRGGPRPPGESADAFRVGAGPLRLDLFGEFESALASLLGDEDYRTTLDAWLEQAEAAVQADAPPNGSPDAQAAWPDRYVPEILRLAARDRKLTRRFAEAAALADLAAQTSERIVDRFPESVSNARIDQSRYLLLSAPEAPERAVDTCRMAIDRWPMVVGDRVRGLRLRQSLAYYLLAAGREADARQVLVDLASERGQPLTDAQLDRIIGYGLGEVCLELAGALPSEQRPESYADFLARSIELVGDWPETRLLAAFEAFEAGRSADAVAHLERMEQLIDDPMTFAGALRMALQAFPEDAVLAAFARPRLEALADRMPPAATGSAPATGPETVPAPQQTPPLQFSIPQTNPSKGPPPPDALE